MDVLYSLVNGTVGAAATDAYQQIRRLVIKYLKQFRGASIEREFDETRRRLITGEGHREQEFERWLSLLSSIAVEPRGQAAINSLAQEIISVSVRQEAHQHNQTFLHVVVNPSGANTQDPGGGQGDVSDEDTEDSTDHQPTTGAGLGCFIVASLILLVLILFFSKSCSGKSPMPPPPPSGFPTHSDPWPTGSTLGAVINPVAQSLTACAKAPVLNPVNCPQSQSYYDPSSVSNVRWGIHGSPTDGARVVYLDGQFQVAGSAIMTASYTDSQGAEFALQLVHYRAWVSWNNGQPQVISIIGFTGNPPRIVKHNPSMARDKINEAVRAAFLACAASEKAPLPPQCPSEPNSVVDGSNAHWQLDNDPLANARETFNSSWGDIHVTGSFSMSATYSVFLFGARH